MPPKDDQMALPAVTALQRRSRHSENEQFHAAVRKLRRTGYRVYRAGRDASLVNGVRIVNTVIEQFAHAPAEKDDNLEISGRDLP